MPASHAVQRVRALLERAGVAVGGHRPWDIRVHQPAFYRRALLGGSLGLGEAYMDGWWDCDRLDEFFDRILRAQVQEMAPQPWRERLDVVVAWLRNLQSPLRAFRIGKAHYDVGNDLYRAMLGSRMVYSCAYWDGGARTLDEAQEAKLDLICRKIGLRAGQRVLDIGCGWGGFARYAAERYGAYVVGVTVSQEQAQLAQTVCRGLPVEIRLQDYRSLDEPFDHVVSVGMFEHVGSKNYRTFMQVVRRCLDDDGLLLLHTIGGNTSVTTTDAWIDRYIFPNSMLPSIQQVGRSCEGLFVMEDWHNLSTNYDRTLMAWHANVGQRWDGLRDAYDERFHRMWTYYLLMCAGAFRARKNQVWQIVLSPTGVRGGYRRDAVARTAEVRAGTRGQFALHEMHKAGRS